MTSGELARLGAVRLSWHMVQHMVLSMIAPMLLVAAAPITLGLGAPTPLSAHFAAATTALGLDPVADQHAAGGFAWAFGEIPALAATMIIFIQWLRQDRREAARHDRLADRTGDAELAAYNARLAQVAKSTADTLE